MALPEDIYLVSLPQFSGDAGYYVHRGRVFVQGYIDYENELATIDGEGHRVEPKGGGTSFSLPLDLTPKLTEAQQHELEETGEVSKTFKLAVDPYHCTPGWMKAIAAEVHVTKEGTHFIIPKFNMPEGPYGKVRVLLAHFWDTPTASSPSIPHGKQTVNPLEGDEDSPDYTIDYHDGSVALLGSRVQFSGTMTPNEKEPDSTEADYEQWNERRNPAFGTGHRRDFDYPFGPYEPAEHLNGIITPQRSTRPDDHDYAIGHAPGARLLPLHIDRRGPAKLEPGVLPTDRYSFYDVYPRAGGEGAESVPSLGKWTAEGNPDQYGMSGPKGGKGVSMFIGNVLGEITTSRGGTLPRSPLTFALAGYSLQVFDLQDYKFGPLLGAGEGKGEEPGEPDPGEPEIFPGTTLDIEEPLGRVFDPEWEVYRWPVRVPQYDGPKVVLDGGPWYWNPVDVTGNGKKYMVGSGWGWHPLPNAREPKSVLMTVTTEPTEDMVNSLPSGNRPPGETTWIIFEWGEVGRLPHESASRGRLVFWDPTPFIEPTFDREMPTEPPDMFVYYLFPVLALLGALFGIAGAAGGAGAQEQFLSVEKFERWIDWVMRYQLEVQLYWMRFDATGHLTPEPAHDPFGDGAVVRRIKEGFADGATVAIGDGVPIWVGSWPLPPWEQPSEVDLTVTGYAAEPNLADIGKPILGSPVGAVIPKG